VARITRRDPRPDDPIFTSGITIVFPMKPTKRIITSEPNVEPSQLKSARENDDGKYP
jgi:hypothetical protein